MNKSGQQKLEIAEYCFDGYKRATDAATLCRALIAVLIMIAVILTIVVAIVVSNLTQGVAGSIRYFIIIASVMFTGVVPLLVCAFLRPVFFYIEAKSTEAMLRCELAIQQQTEYDECDMP